MIQFSNGPIITTYMGCHFSCLALLRDFLLFELETWDWTSFDMESQRVRKLVILELDLKMQFQKIRQIRTN